MISYVFLGLYILQADVLALNPKKCKNQKHDIHRTSVRMLGKDLTFVEVQEHVQTNPTWCKTHP